MQIGFRWGILATVASTVGLVTFGPPANARVVAVPNGLAEVEGNFQTRFPFSCGTSYASQRLQQIYLGAEVGSGTIAEIRFRQDDVQGTAFGPTVFSNVTIALSTTSVAVGSLDATFANNVGADVTTVFSGDLTLSSAPCSSSPCPFDIVVPLATAFPFDASAGNLLLDVTIPTCAETSEFDAVLNGFGSVARVFTTDSGSASTMADQVSSRGLVSQFTFHAEPAPALSVWGMSALIVALFSLGAVVVHRRSRT